MTTLDRPKLLLVDGHSMAFRGFFALPVEKFATTTGVATNAVYGFLSMLITLLKDEQPSHVAVAFDAGSHTFRTEQYPAYKGTREKTPEEFKHQIPLIEEVLHTLGITTMSKDLIEADDIIATLSHEAGEAGMDVLVCSGDRDTLQLVNERVTVLYPKRGVSDLARMTPEAVYDKYQVTPAQYPDLAAMVGETSDNLPGVPGVGPKTAAKWLGQYGDLDSVLANAEELTGKVGQSLRDHVDQVRMNRRLGQLLRDVELPAQVQELTMKPWDRAAIDQVLDSLQFRTLRERLFALDAAGAPTESAATEMGVELVQLDRTPLKGWLADATGPLGIAIDGNQLPVDSDVWRLAIGRADGEAVVIDFAQVGRDDEATLREWLADEARPKTSHGVKGLLHALSSRDISLAGVVFDSQLAAYLAHPDQRSYDLPALAMRYLGVDLAATDDSGQGSLDLGDDSAAQAIGSDAVVLAQLEALQREELAGIESLALLTDLELPVTRLLADMERVGIAVDTPYLVELSKEFAGQAEDSAQAAYDQIGHPVNLSSPKQLQTVLFDELGMPKTKKIKTGYTTDAAALAELHAKTGNAFLAHLLAYRDTTKLKQTVDGLIRSTAVGNRIHTTFQQTVAATGRLSSTEPNLQNIPVRTEAGRRIRRAFVVSDGYETLLTADYSQIEMRIMAHLSGDAGLIEAFNSGEDLHNFVGSRVFSVAPSDVTPAMRSKIKAMSYGLAYGLSAFGLSKQLNIDVAEARGLMADYFERFGGVRDYLHAVVEEARSTGYTATILGRRRYLPDLTSDSRQRREMAERMALNAPIQGSAADIIKIAMLQVNDAFVAEDLSSRLLLQVHDELIVEVAPGELDSVQTLMRDKMASAASLSVPLDVSVGVGDSWLAASH